jgi:pimeloyl-ACP methyl ester carboxylesterase
MTLLRRAILHILFVATVSAVFAEARAGIEDRFFDSNGVRLRYVDVGSGPTVILVHGFSSDLESNWRKPGILDALAQRFRVVALDCRGHGKSAKPHDEKLYGLQMVEDITRLMDHLQLTKVSLVGYSMGASIVGKFVASHPDRVAAAVFGAGMPNVGWSEKNERDTQELASSLEKGEGMRPLVLRLWPTDSPKPTEEVLTQRSLAVLGQNDPVALAHMYRSRRGHVVTLSEYKSLRVPLLAVVGSADPYNVAIAALAHDLPDLKVVIVDGASHAGTKGLQARPEFTTEVQGFLKTALAPHSSERQ